MGMQFKPETDPARYPWETSGQAAFYFMYTAIVNT
jgi:hypothetical protein